MRGSNALPKRRDRRRAEPVEDRAAAGSVSRPADPPLTNLRFEVGIAGTTSGRAVEVIFPVARIAVTRGRPRTVLTPLVIRRGLTRSTEWYDWWNEARHGSPAVRRLVTVAVLSADGREAVRWLFRDSVPVAYSLSPLNALAGAPLFESLEVQPGGFELFERQ